MKWNRLLAGAVCASLLSVPVWAVEGGEAPAAGAGQTSSTACRVTLDGVCLDLSEAPAAPYQENGQVMLPLWKVAQALGWTVTWLPEENGTRIENEDQVMNLTYGLDRYACASKSSIGATSPEHYGAAPVVVAGRTYVPRLHVPAALLHRDDGGGDRGPADRGRTTHGGRTALRRGSGVSDRSRGGAGGGVPIESSRGAGSP